MKKGRKKYEKHSRPQKRRDQEENSLAIQEKEKSVRNEIAAKGFRARKKKKKKKKPFGSRKTREKIEFTGLVGKRGDRRA